MYAGVPLRPDCVEAKNSVENKLKSMGGGIPKNGVFRTCGFLCISYLRGGNRVRDRLWDAEVRYNKLVVLVDQEVCRLEDAEHFFNPKCIISFKCKTHHLWYRIRHFESKIHHFEYLKVAYFDPYRVQLIHRLRELKDFYCRIIAKIIVGINILQWKINIFQ